MIYNNILLLLQKYWQVYIILCIINYIHKIIISLFACRKRSLRFPINVDHQASHKISKRLQRIKYNIISKITLTLLYPEHAHNLITSTSSFSSAKQSHTCQSPLSATTEDSAPHLLGKYIYRSYTESICESGGKNQTTRMSKKNKNVENSKKKYEGRRFSNIASRNLFTLHWYYQQGWVS